MSAARTRRRQSAPSRKAVAGLSRLAKGSCSLCDRPASCISVWFPTLTCQRRLLTPPGKDRRVVIPFCAAHGAASRIDGSMARAQEILMAQADRMAASGESN